MDKDILSTYIIMYLNSYTTVVLGVLKQRFDISTFNKLIILCKIPLIPTLVPTTIIIMTLHFFKFNLELYNID